MGQITWEGAETGFPAQCGADHDFPWRRIVLFMRTNPREGAALEAFVTLLWDLGLALAHGWGHNALPYPEPAGSLKVVGTTKH